MHLTSEGRVLKMWMLGVMLIKVRKLYPKFADTVTCIEAHRLLAQFCLPEEEQNVVDTLDLYYVSVVAHELNIPFTEVYQGFELASQSEESQSQQ